MFFLTTKITIFCKKTAGAKKVFAPAVFNSQLLIVPHATDAPALGLGAAVNTHGAADEAHAVSVVTVRSTAPVAPVRAGLGELSKEVGWAHAGSGEEEGRVGARVVN